MSSEKTAIPIFDVQHNADAWFSFDPDDMENSEAEHRYHLAALYKVDTQHPDVSEKLEHLRTGTKSLLARTLVRSTLEIAYDDYALAVDSLTGLKTQEELNRWVISTFGKAQAPAEKRKPRWKKQPYMCLRGDLNNFKRINEWLDEPIGDEVLRAAGEEIVSNLRAGDHIIAARNHKGGDEFTIVGTGLNERDTKGFWKRLYAKQLEKVGRQEHIWNVIEEAIGSRPEEQKVVRVLSEVTHVEGEGLEVKKRILEVNGRRICEIGELAVIDLGYAFGVPGSLEDIEAINDQARAHKDKIKKATRTKIDPYRPV